MFGLKNPFRCKCCDVKDNEIDYLRKMVDRLHEKIGINEVFDPGRMLEDFEAENLDQDAEGMNYEEVGG